MSVQAASSSHPKAALDHSPIDSIAPDGDIVVLIEHSTSDTTHKTRLRLRVAALQATSRYFATLLDGRFGEAIRVRQQYESLKLKYPDVSKALDEELPLLRIEDLGRISTVKSTGPLLADFFAILHGKDTQAPPPAANLANLAVVADRFDALDAVKGYVRRKKLIKIIDTKTTSKQDSALTEDKIRQRAFIGLMFDDWTWLARYSARLITKPASEAREVTDALWWDMPGRVEDEIAFRRQCILDTIQALQSHFLEAYTSRSRQCRLGYSSSGECDSFQLGEMIRFFCKIGTLRLQGNLAASHDAITEYTGDLNILLDRMKQAPEYQVDVNHTHCGIRTRIIPLLGLIAAALPYVGIDSQTGKDWRQHAWIDAKRPLLWRRTKDEPLGPTVTDGKSEEQRETVRALFMADNREWE